MLLFEKTFHSLPHIVLAVTRIEFTHRRNVMLGEYETFQSQSHLAHHHCYEWPLTENNNNNALIEI